MGIMLARIDDRLIHGQVIVGWVRRYKIDRIIVSDDRAAKDVFQKSLIEMAVPDSEIEVSVLTTEEASDRILKGHLENHRAILLMSSPGEALRLLKKGVRMPVLNIGNIRHTDGCERLAESVFASEKCLTDFKELHRLGVRLEYQAAPDDPAIDLSGRFDSRLKVESHR
jgi:PTS system mannose-specific IIB component